MNVHLAPHLEAMVRRKLAIGPENNASDVIGAARRPRRNGTASRGSAPPTPSARRNPTAAKAGNPPPSATPRSSQPPGGKRGRTDGRTPMPSRRLPAFVPPRARIDDKDIVPHGPLTGEEGQALAYDALFLDASRDRGTFPELGRAPDAIDPGSRRRPVRQHVPFDRIAVASRPPGHTVTNRPATPRSSPIREDRRWRPMWFHDSGLRSGCRW